jgi:tetratricopeptide (TPR) repeat protein
MIDWGAVWRCHAALFCVSFKPMTEHDRPRPELDAHIRSSMTLIEDGELTLAEEACRRALAVDPKHPAALAVLGLVLHGAARFGEAQEVFLELTRLEPQVALHWMNLGTARRGLTDLDGALRAYTRAAQLGAASADFFYNIGLTHLDRHDYEAARATLKRAAELAPSDAAIRLEYARSCYESLQTEEAVAALAGWEQFEGLAPDLVANIGQRLMNLGESSAAESAVQQLTSARELDPRASLTLAQIFERTNRLDEARAVANRLARDPRANSLGPELTSLQAQLAQRADQHEQAAKLFGEALARRTEFHTQHFELFALAKSLDALGRYEEAFTTATEAHRSQAAHFKLTAPLASARGAPAMVITDYGCDPRDVATWAGVREPAATDSPIFIVAFPRSGTTLLELTLDAHPDLVSIDEQPFVQAALDDLLATGVRYPEQLGQATPRQLELIRERYWERVRGKAQIHAGQRLVDKNPLNLMRLPVIRRLFPEARIVLAIRHPCDVLLSCFLQHFRAPDFALLCADLPTLAAGYRKAFDFWYQQAQLLQPAVTEVRYENFVADFESQTRALLDFLKVPWESSVLAPGARAQARGYISTPSYSQVVQPVNQKSIGRWKPYARHFQAVLPLLQPYLARWGYEG